MYCLILAWQSTTVNPTSIVVTLDSLEICGMIKHFLFWKIEVQKTWNRRWIQHLGTLFHGVQQLLSAGFLNSKWVRWAKLMQWASHEVTVLETSEEIYKSTLLDCRVKGSEILRYFSYISGMCVQYLIWTFGYDKAECETHLTK